MLDCDDSGTDGEVENIPKNKRKHNLAISEIQRIRIDRLMSHPDKPAHIPELREPKTPRAFDPHEFVRNVMGASAGAGSGEFDIYRGCRRRQRIRQDFLYYQEKQKLANDEWRRRIKDRQMQNETKTAKKREKRLKGKARARDRKEKIKAELVAKTNEGIREKTQNALEHAEANESTGSTHL